MLLNQPQKIGSFKKWEKIGICEKVKKWEVDTL